MKIETTASIDIVLALAVLALPGTAMGQDRFQSNIRVESVGKLNDAKALNKTGKSEQAEDKLSRLTKEEPAYFAAHYNLGLVQAEATKYPQAIASLERARDLREKNNIKDATIYNSLGWAYMLNGELAKAEEAFAVAKINEKSLSRESRARLYNNTGWLYMSTGRYEEARKSFDAAAKDYDSSFARENLKTLSRLEESRKSPPQK